MSDRELRDRVLAGDRAAENELVERLRPWIVGLVRRRFGLAEDEAEEIWHRLVVRLWEHDKRALRAWGGEGKLSTYLSVIAVRLVLRERRASSTPVTEPLGDREPTAPLGGPPGDPPGDPIARLVAEQEARQLARGWATLRARDRLLLALRYRDGRPTRELATLVGISPGAARKALHDALARLRRAIAGGRTADRPGNDPTFRDSHCEDVDMAAEDPDPRDDR